jgi:cytochrome b6-f complex iron-sulfur subunit
MWLSACGGNPMSPSGGSAPALPSVAATVSGRTVSISIDASSPLANVGGAAMAQTSIGGFLIAHVGADTYNVMTSTCTHEACTIDGFSNSRFVCPCHGSQFSTSGTVLVGPAPTSLKTFASVFDSGTGALTFTA